MDDLYTKKRCDRCGGTLEFRTLSMMNMDVICLVCAQEEKTHPDYNAAADMERQQTLMGNKYFEGMFAGKKYPFER